MSRQSRQLEVIRLNATAGAEADALLRSIDAALNLLAGWMQEAHGRPFWVHIDHKNGMLAVAPEPERRLPRPTRGRTI